MKGFKKLFKGFEKAMAATAFAEEGEFETARQIVKEADEAEATRPRKVDTGTKASPRTRGLGAEA